MNKTDTVKLTARLSPTEAELVRHTVAASGLSQNQFLRQCLLDGAYALREGRKSTQQRHEFLIRNSAFTVELLSRMAMEFECDHHVAELKETLRPRLEQAGYIDPYKEAERGKQGPST